ncbi:hypothetical protein [Phenylobacterium sp.]|jgi:hypothetical protein|uniref:hypothetical protein n=1 Tax=Phenylobacterium sp. TaxID=1871053 RepID=UPI000C8E5A33|nr:hypothetical protein [Phenylobacterium sp.]MAK80477.1 hypothetical protein [Phenylobacterium sp.]|tara:strand:- start:10185 stop:10631 length:447 start_codon:yes stop_codon:yes gene_type:complete
MTPAVSQVLADLAGRVARNAAPNIPAADRAGELGLSALLLGLAAEMWDGAAEILAQENADLRALLAAGAKVWGEDTRRRWLDALSQGRDESLRLSALQSANGELKVALIALHAELERRDDPEARALESQIWRALVAASDRRRLSGSPV